MGGRGKGIGESSRRGSFESIRVSVDPDSENTVSAVGTVLLPSLNADTLQFAIRTVEGLMSLSPLLHTHSPVVRFHRVSEKILMTS